MGTGRKSVVMDKNDALNRENLAKKLRIAKVPDHMYNLSGKGRTDERFCLKKLDNQWQVYYSERGVKTTNKIFDSEKDACQYIYDQLTDMRKGDVFSNLNKAIHAAKLSLKCYLGKRMDKMEGKANCITEKRHNELIGILSELITTIELMEKEHKEYLLSQNKNEAKEWLAFLKDHTDKEELKSLENEIADRLFYRFDVQIMNTELDDKRAELMKTYLIKSYEYLK